MTNQGPRVLQVLTKPNDELVSSNLHHHLVFTHAFISIGISEDLIG